MHKLQNLVLMEAAKKTILRNSGVSNVCTFLHAYFKNVEFYFTRRCVHLTKEGTESDLFVSEEEEGDDELLKVSELSFLVQQKVCGVEI